MSSTKIPELTLAPSSFWVNRMVRAHNKALEEEQIRNAYREFVHETNVHLQRTVRPAVGAGSGAANGPDPDASLPALKECIAFLRCHGFDWDFVNNKMCYLKNH